MLFVPLNSEIVWRYQTNTRQVNCIGCSECTCAPFKCILVVYFCRMCNGLTAEVQAGKSIRYEWFDWCVTRECIYISFLSAYGFVSQFVVY